MAGRKIIIERFVIKPTESPSGVGQSFITARSERDLIFMIPEEDIEYSKVGLLLMMIKWNEVERSYS